MIDFVDIWKAASIVLAGAFGILGLLTEYKDQNKHITKWGRISLVGILFSTSMGLVAGVKEAFDKQSAKEASAKQTLRIVEQTQRLLQPFEVPSIIADFEVPCRDEFREFCERVYSKDDQQYWVKDCQKIRDQQIWARWPKAPGSDSFEMRPRLFVSIAITKKQDSRGREEWQLWYDVPPLTQYPPKNGMIPLMKSGTESDVARISLQADGPNRNTSDGSFQSTLDLDGATIRVSGNPAILWRGAAHLKLLRLLFNFKNGRSLDLTDNSFKEEFDQNGFFYFESQIKLLSQK
jgi:hypothetical protein